MIAGYRRGLGFAVLAVLVCSGGWMIRGFVSERGSLERLLHVMRVYNC